MPNEKPHISLIVAMARNRVIGVAGGIPWRLPNELKLFKRLTMGHHMIMGRVTYESIGRLLPGRTTVIVTRQRDYAVPGAIVVNSLPKALDASRGDAEIFVIGGAKIYQAALPVASRIYLTTVAAEPVGDTYMPEFDPAQWRETHAETFGADEQHAHDYRFSVLERVPRTASGEG